MPEVVSNVAPPEIECMVTKLLENAVLAKESSQPQSLYEAAALLTEFDLKKILIDKMDKSKSYMAAPKHRESYEGLIKSYDLYKYLFSTYSKVYSLKRSRKDKDKDEDPSAGSDRGIKKRKTSKDAEPTKVLKEPEFEVADLEMTQDQEENLGNDDVEPKEKDQRPDFSKAHVPIMLKLEYDFEECYKALLEKLDWENLEGGDYPFDLTKPLPLGISHWREQHKSFYRYGYLKEIVVRRADSILFRFKKGNFPRLRINDIEDILLLIVQNQLTNLSGDDVSDFVITLRMFTRSLVIKKRVEDLQLGVENYQKNINITRPQTTISGIRKRDPYTPYQDPQGFIYVNNNGRNRLM
ncbi:hypothetical protein Tco_1539076 [Tanacetum coccineum]